MWNHSKSIIHFEWERIVDTHVIEVEPSTGEIGQRIAVYQQINE